MLKTQNKGEKKTGKKKEPLPIELSQGQLVVAVCVFLVAALVCYALGYACGKYEERRTQTTVATTTQPVQQTNPAPKVERTLPKTSPSTSRDQIGVQKSPRPLIPPQTRPTAQSLASKPESAPVRKIEYPAPPQTIRAPETKTAPATNGAAAAKATAETSKPAPQPKPTQPQQPQQPVKPAQQETKQADKPAAPKEAPKQEDKAPAQPPKTQPEPAKPQQQAPTTPAGTTPPPPPVRDKEEIPLESAAAAKPPSQTPPAAPAQAVAQPTGAYGVQIASFSGANRTDAAQRYCQELAAKSSALPGGLKPELVASKMEGYVSVVVGRFPDKASASAACTQLKARPEFSGCFVRKR